MEGSHIIARAAAIRHTLRISAIASVKPLRPRRGARPVCSLPAARISALSAGRFERQTQVWPGKFDTRYTTRGQVSFGRTYARNSAMIKAFPALLNDLVEDQATEVRSPATDGELVRGSRSSVRRYWPQPTARLQ